MTEMTEEVATATEMTGETTDVTIDGTTDATTGGMTEIEGEATATEMTGEMIGIETGKEILEALIAMSHLVIEKEGDTEKMGLFLLTFFPRTQYF